MVLTSRSVQVSWNASFLSCVTGYVISYTSYASSGNVNVNDVYQTSYNLTDLEECTEYNITMHVDSARINPDSIRIMITAYTDSTGKYDGKCYNCTTTPSSPPQNITVMEHHSR